jgi:hypothetical protein
MSRKLRPLAALVTVALIGACSSSIVAANGDTASKASSSAPGTLPPKGASRTNASSSAPGTLPPMGSSRSRASSSAPGTLPPMGSSR